MQPCRNSEWVRVLLVLDLSSRAVQCVKGDDGAICDAEFGQQRLRRRDLVGFLSDVHVFEHQRRLGRERA